MQRRILLFIVAALLFCAGGAAAAQFQLQEGTSTLTCDYLEYRSSDNVIMARGQVVIISSASRLRADEAVIYVGTRTAVAWGDVRVIDAGRAIWGERMEYAGAASTGTLAKGYIESPPWRIWSREMTRLPGDQYKLKRAAVTNCDLDPPHYHFRGRTGSYAPERRVTVYGGALVPERSPLLYTPFWTKSLREKRWSLRVDPGRSGRDGIFAKTILGYPVLPNTYGRLYWDYYERTGYRTAAEYNYFLPDLQGSIFGSRLRDRQTDRLRWEFSAGHFQRINPRLSMRGSAFYVSDAEYSGQYTQNDRVIVNQDIRSEGGLTYQHPAFSTQLSVAQLQSFDRVKREFFVKRNELPRLSVQSASLSFGPEIYLNLNGNFANVYDRPADPINPDLDLYRQTANASASLSRTIRISSSTTFVPGAGISEEWQAWTAQGSTRSRKDVYQGRVFTDASLRQRFGRRLDADLSYSYRVRWAANEARRDRASADQGTEGNSIGLVFTYLAPAVLNRLTLRSGYDLRDPEGQSVASPREKIVPPTLEASASPARWLSLFYRQTERLFPIRRTQAAQFSFQVGPSLGPKFESSYSYNESRRGQVQVRHGAAFPLTKGWWLDGALQYNASGAGKTHFNRVQIIDKILAVERDLHCWHFHLDYTQRPGIEERVTFRVDVKPDIAARENLRSPRERQYYPGRSPERRLR